MNNSNWQENLRGKILASFYLYQGEVRPPKWFLKVIEDTLGHTSSLLEEERQVWEAELNLVPIVNPKEGETTYSAITKKE